MLAFLILSKLDLTFKHCYSSYCVHVTESLSSGFFLWMILFRDSIIYSDFTQ